MSSTSTAPARALRASAVSAWATSGSVAAHVAGSGEVPPTMALLPPLALGLAGAWWAAGRRLTPWVVVALLALPQVAVHVLSGYVHGHQMMPSAAMLATHVLGTLAVAWGLAGADRVWWSWWASVRLVLRTAAPDLTVTPGTAPALRAALPVATMLRHVLVRRGPPAALRLGLV